MVDNQHNYYHTAPDKGTQNGPVWDYSGSLDQYLTNLRNGFVVRGGYGKNNGTRRTAFKAATNPISKRQNAPDSYWLTTLGPLGAVSCFSLVQCMYVCILTCVTDFAG